MKSLVAVAVLALVQPLAGPLAARADDSIRVGGTNPGIRILNSTSAPRIIMWDEDTSAGMSFEVTESETSWSFGLAGELNLTTGGDDVQIRTFNNASLDLMSAGVSHRFFVDYGGNFDDGESFSWWQDNAILGPTQLMNLDDAQLQIAGTLQENSGFDLAESFLKVGEIEPEELVAVVPGRPRAVRRATGAPGEILIGPVSRKPGILMGGGAFSVEALEAQWGEEVAREYESRVDELQARVLSQDRELAEEQRRLDAEASDAQGSRSGGPVPMQACEAHRACRPGPALPARLAARALAEARRDLAARLERRTLQEFFGDRFVSIALAGRVRVKADASHAPIRPGDPLTASPGAGVAMKASQPGPVVGTALEGLAASRGSIEMLVHRGWYGGATTRLAASPSGCPPDADARVAALGQRVAALEAVLGALAQGPARRTSAAVATR